MRLFNWLQIGLGLILVMIAITPALAQTDNGVFSSLDSLYTVSETTTYVTHTLTFENQNPTVFIKQFGFQIPHQNLDNIRVEVDQQPIVPNTVKTDNHTSIAVTFADKLVGQGKKRTISITYQDPEIASFTANSGRVFIPQPNQIDAFDRYTLTVNTPQESGLPAISSQTPSETRQGSAGTVVSYNQLQPGTLSLYYGQTQPYTFELNYNLTNPSDSATIQQIPLPPDTAFQTVVFSQIEPSPERIEADEDGNWIATYQVPDQSDLQVKIAGQVELSRTPHPNHQVPQPKNKHLRSDQFWNTDEDSIKSFIQDATSMEEIWQQLTPLGQYLVSDQIRSNPTDALTHQQTSAENLVDLLITAARVKDIPARRVIGIANQDEEHPLGLKDAGLHVWADYFDPSSQNWQPMDPFWQFSLGDTSFVNQPHLANMVLAYNGLSSTSPYPNHLDSEIAFIPGNDFFPAQASFSTLLSPRTPLQLPVPGAYQLEITNQTGQARYQLPITVTDDRGQVVFQTQLAALLPFQSTTVPISVYTNNWFTTDEVTLQLALDDQHQTVSLTRGPKVLSFIFTPVGLVLGVGLIITTLGAGSLLVLRRS